MTNKKMTANQRTSGALSLDEFIAGADPVSEPKKATSGPRKGQGRGTTPKKAQKPLGRPSEVKGAPRKAVVNIKFTEEEKQTLEKLASGVPLSTFVRSLLKDQGVI